MLMDMILIFNEPTKKKRCWYSNRINKTLDVNARSIICQGKNENTRATTSRMFINLRNKEEKVFLLVLSFFRVALTLSPLNYTKKA